MLHRALIALATLVVTGWPVTAQSPADFYAGKTITLIISTGAGGGLDASARLMARHMGNHIPGKPSIVPKNMPGAGHVLAANYVYGVATPDGTTIGAILPSIVGFQKLDGKGATYDAAKFPWLGSLDIDNQNLYAWHTTGVKTVADLRTREVLIGGTGAGSYSVLWPAVMNNLLGTRFKIVSGYKSTKEVHLAMQRGEVEARAGNFFSSLKSQSGDWLAEKKISVLVQFGVQRDPDFMDVPLLTELATNEDQRAIFTFLSGQVGMGKAVLTSPGIATERLAVLRTAFDAMSRDADYQAEASRLNLGVRAASHEAIAAIAKSVLDTPEDVIAKTRAAIVAKTVEK